MKIINVKCPDCNASIPVSDKEEFFVCEFCGAKIRSHIYKKKEPKQKNNLREKVPVIILFSFVSFFVAVLLIAIITPPPQTPDDPNIIKAGVYLVGTDIDAGDYVLYRTQTARDTGGNGTLEVRLTKEKALNPDDFLYKKTFLVRQHLSLNDGEYVEFVNAECLSLN